MKKREFHIPIVLEFERDVEAALTGIVVPFRETVFEGERYFVSRRGEKAFPDDRHAIDCDTFPGRFLHNGFQPCGVVEGNRPNECRSEYGEKKNRNEDGLQ